MSKVIYNETMDIEEVIQRAKCGLLDVPEKVRPGFLRRISDHAKRPGNTQDMRMLAFDAGYDAGYVEGYSDAGRSINTNGETK